MAAMQPSKRELPGVLIFLVALTAGVLAALAVQIWFTAAGYDLTTVWQDLVSSNRLNLRAAGPWWAMAGAAFVASGATAATLSRLPLPWRRLRLVRWILGTLLVFGLAHIGHSGAGATMSAHLGTQVAVSLGAILIAAVLATIGTFLVRR